MTSKQHHAPDHPFFTEILDLPQKGVLAPQGVVRRIIETANGNRHICLQLIHDGYASICQTAPAVFDRIASNTNDDEAKAVATYLRDVELGLHPLVQGAAKISHEELFRRMMQSLSHEHIEPLHSRKNPLLKTLEIGNADAPTLVSYGRTIEEDFAPPLAGHWEDFLVQWQALTGLHSTKVDRRFVREHGLTEGIGEDSEVAESQMHVDVIGRMCAPFAAQLRDVYEEKREKYHRELCAHLDRYHKRILQIIPQ